MLEIDLDHEKNPLIVAFEVGRFVSDGLRDGSISLFSAFLLNQDLLSLKRMGYRQSAWQYQLSLSGVLALYSAGLLLTQFSRSTIRQQDPGQ